VPDLDRWSSADATAYLTPARMATAKPWPGSDKPDTAPSLTARTGSSRFEGLPVVGTLFRVEGSGVYFCSASVVSSPKRSLVITAAHCLTGRESANQLAFAPKLQKDSTGKLVAPYGLFSVKRDSGRSRVWMDRRYATDKQVYAQYDVAFLEVGPGTNNRQVENTVGGNRLITDPGFNHQNVHLVAYPGANPPPLTCTSSTRREAFSGWPGAYLRIDCDGYSGGSSGGPFIANFNETTKTGDVIGVIGGYRTGGTTDDTSYSSYFGADIKALYDSAVRGDKPQTGGVLGTATTWKHATQIASGYFTTTPADYTSSDMVVRWSDGEVTLYIGDGDGDFEKEVRLVGPNSTWTHAEAITAGDYTGSNLYDLMVRWSDGEVTIYKDVSEQNKLSQEIQLAKPNATWTHALGLATGRYAGNKWPDDLIVRWSDGEVTLYTDVDEKGFHGETQLARPNTTWKNATVITGGDFDGESATESYDLMVRWVDGEVTLYTNVDSKGFHKETQIRAPNSLWAEHAKLMTAGDFTDNAWQDDLIVVWTDGEVSHYIDTDEGGLGKEYTLVSPGTIARTATALPVLRGSVGIPEGSTGPHGKPHGTRVRPER